MGHEDHDAARRPKRPDNRVQDRLQWVDVLDAQQEDARVVGRPDNSEGRHSSDIANNEATQVAMASSGQGGQARTRVDPHIPGTGPRDIRSENALTRSDVEDGLAATRIEKLKRRGDSDGSVIVAAPASDPAVVPARNAIPASVSRSVSPSGTLLVPGHGGTVPWWSNL
jgi:hypothetical protein